MSAMSDVERAELTDRLSIVQMRIILRCSDAPLWDRTGRTFARQWPDLVSHVEHASMRSLRALERRGLVYEDDVGFGLTEAGFDVQYELQRRGMRA